MADGAGTSGRGRRAHRGRGMPIARSDATNAVEPRSGRPTPAERAEAVALIEALMALGLLRKKARAVEPATIALALAWRRSDSSLDGLSAVRRNSLFNVGPRSQVLRDWVDDPADRLGQALAHVARGEQTELDAIATREGQQGLTASTS